ncbi:MAG: Na+/H+ antiporter NhaC family protein [Bacteroides sp.]|nr:Na+/H+ antiporter NhaC family protein [Bacteroides sp.]MCM1413552.1 Na+/H+ antiporter NhaC family protein [Bacteroides sp.]MCM1471106.1 Na+/H+ antiporter NhaC family protein [Bacteroides sp.]
MNEFKRIDPWQGLKAVSPVLVFLISYVVVSVMIGDFYKMPLSVSLVAASVWGILMMRDTPLMKRIEVFSRSAGHDNILYMIWVFVLAGAFAMLAKRLGAVEATVDLALSVFPASSLVPTLFFSACFISLSIGTSVGTVVALAPLAAEMAEVSGAPVPFFVAVVLGGAFFGDNLSFISDTTIAATRSQGVGMSDKFKANIIIALPAAVLTLVLYILMSQHAPDVDAAEVGRPWLVLPYLAVILLAVFGVNVSVVLLAGILSAIAMGFIYGFGAMDMASYCGEGIDSMGNLIIITLLAAGMLGLVKQMGGIEFILRQLTRRISDTRGAQAVIALLVGLVNLCTANNTVAIITVGGITRTISERYGVAGRKAASILDTASCIVQCLIPYGAQTLLATSLAGISPAAPWPYLYYPWILTVMLIISILVKRSGSRRRQSEGESRENLRPTGA